MARSLCRYKSVSRDGFHEGIDVIVQCKTSADGFREDVKIRWIMLK